MAAFKKAVIDAFRAFVARVVAIKAELLAALAGIVGWAFVTWAIAGLFAPVFVWRISIGLFFLSLHGFGFLRQIALKGLYTLTKVKK